MHGEMLTYGLKRGTKSELLYVDNVPNGLGCDCVCPHCHHELMAKNGGSKNTHHFAHASGADCGGARMTALHMMAQNVLMREKKVMLPDYNGEYYQEVINGVDFDEVLLEQSHNLQDTNLRPDCVGIKRVGGNEHHLWIEICVTHEVDEQKQKHIRDARIACIEIDLSDMLDADYTKESVTQRLLDRKEDRVWICCPKCDKKEEQERQKEERRKASEKEYQLQQEAIFKQYREDVLSWYEDGDARKAEAIIREIKNKPYRDEAKIYDALVPHNNFLEFIDESPKNKSGLNVFYTLLWYYYFKVKLTDFQTIKQNLKLFLYSIDQQTKEDKIRLEEIISLRILYILDRNRKKYSEVDPDDVYKTCIKKYLSVTEIRNEILMLVSVLYHQIIGFDSKNFGELTQEIIQNHPNLSKIYLMVIDSQDKYPNDYTLDGRDMLAELRQYVADNECNANEYVNNIMQECYSFVFEKKDYIRKESDATITPVNSFSRIPNQDAWDRINKWYQES